MTGYQQCVLYLTSTHCDGRLVVRNVDRWYIDTVSGFFSMHPFLQKRSETGKRDYWCIKDSINHPVSFPVLSDVADWEGFIRCFIEIRGSLDVWKHKNRHGITLFTLRLRIYGQLDDLCALMCHLPVGEKKIQHISTQTGKTCMISFQSPDEVRKILNFIDGSPKNSAVWEKWEALL